jgi:GDP-L-fucose synthase
MVNLNEIKKILLTGGSGMVGKSIQNHPDIHKWELISPSRKELNLHDYKSTEIFLKEHRPDLIIHAAGHCGGIHTSIAEPVDFLVNNIDIGRNIIIAAKNTGTKKLINLASSCMYPKNAQNPLSENLILTGELEPTNEGYALAKIFSTKLCEYINKEQSNFNYKTIIPCNLYGPNDKFDPKRSHAIASIIHKIYNAKKNNDKEIEIWGDGLTRREFMYVDDLADCVVEGIKRFSDLPYLMNSGMGKDYNIKEYYKVVAKSLDWKGNFIHDYSKPVGMKQKVICTKILRNFGWSHKTSLDQGIKLTVDYYNNMINNYGKTIR